MKKKPGTRPARESVDLGMALVVAWKTSARVTEYLLDHLDATLWRAEPPDRKGRTPASIFALHNVRHMLLVQARAAGIPPKLDRVFFSRGHPRGPPSRPDCDARAPARASALAGGDAWDVGPG